MSNQPYSESVRDGAFPASLYSLFGSPRPAHALLCAMLGLCLALSLACDRNVEAYQPGEEPSQPDLARIFPAPEGGVGARESAGGANAGGGGPVPRQAVPPARAESGGGAAPSPVTASANAAAAPITGIIDIAPERAGSQPTGAILFVIARPQGARGGPPLAVLRVANPIFPLPFSIGPENVMIPTMKFAGSISLSARLDADGNAMTRGAGDVSSLVKEPLEPGATGVELLLSE